MDGEKTHWHTLNPREAAQRLDTDPRRGLSAKTAAARLEMCIRDSI